MATLILRETYLALEKEMKSIDKLRTETALKINYSPIPNPPAVSTS